MFKSKSNDIGIDLGTANILIYRKGEGIILNQPSVVTVETATRRVTAVGDEAYSMIGRTSGKYELVRPLKDGVIADFDITEQMINIFLDKLKIKGLFVRPRILICCPTNITKVERDAIKNVAVRCGAKKVYVEEEPKVAAVGSGLEIFEPVGNLIIDIGGGTTDIAVLSMGDIVNSSSIKVAGDVLTNDIIKYIKEKYKLLIGQRMAEDIKIEIATAMDPDETNTKEIKGRDLVSGLPKTIVLSEADIKVALEMPIAEIIHETKTVLERTEPELASDIINQGIVLTGGGALIKNLDKLFEREIHVPVYISEDPLNAVARGSGLLLEYNDDPTSNVNLV